MEAQDDGIFEGFNQRICRSKRFSSRRLLVLEAGYISKTWEWEIDGSEIYVRCK